MGDEGSTTGGGSGTAMSGGVREYNFACTSCSSLDSSLRLFASAACAAVVRCVSRPASSARIVRFRRSRGFRCCRLLATDSAATGPVSIGGATAAGLFSSVTPGSCRNVSQTTAEPMTAIKMLAAPPTSPRREYQGIVSLPRVCDPGETQQA